MSGITTHVLDTARGVPAHEIRVRVERQDSRGSWDLMGEGSTDPDGRARDLLADGGPLKVGIYRLVFETGEYLRAQGAAGFYPRVEVIFEVADPTQHYHVPLLLSPYGYATYRGR